MSEKTVQSDKSGPNWILAIPVLLVIFCLELGLIYTSLGSQSPQWFSLFSGLFGGLSIGLFATNFASKTLNMGILFNTLIVVYAVIQPIYPLLMSGGGGFLTFFVPAMFGVALFIKIFLFLRIQWLIDSGRMTYYMVRTLHLVDKEDEVRNRVVFLIEYGDTDKLKEEEVENHIVLWIENGGAGKDRKDEA